MRNNYTENKRIPLVSLVLIVINTIIFFVMEFLGPTNDIVYMYNHGASYAPDIFENGQWYRIFTSMFLHFGIEHMLNNMAILYIIGYQIEKEYGRIKFLITYLICGIFGGLFSAVVDMVTEDYCVSAGASGAIFGMFGVLLVITFRNKAQLEKNSILQYMLLFALVVFGDMSEGIGWIAHLGGALMGVILGILLYRRKHK